MDQSNETNPLTLQSNQNLFDGLAATCAVGGAIAAAATQSIAVAAFPLAGAIGLHIFNRRQLMAAMTTHYEAMIRQQNLYIVNHQNSLQALSDRLEQVQGEWSEQLEGYARNAQRQMDAQGEKIANLQQVTVELNQFTENLDTHHQQLTEVVDRLQQIENASHSLQSDPNSAQMYYQRGLNFQQLGDKAGAIADLNRAIQLDPQYAKAFHCRGLLRSELGERQAAVDDLREAAKFYFEMGDIENYQQARDLAKELYDNSVGNIATSDRSTDKKGPASGISEQILVGGLFGD